MDGIEKVQQILQDVSIIPTETSKEKRAKIEELYVGNCFELLKYSIKIA